MKLVHVVALSIAMVTGAAPVLAQALPAQNQVNVSAQASISYSSDTGLFTYRYSFTNFPDAKLEVSQLHIPLRGASVLNISAPPGWEPSVSGDGSLLSWCACAENGFVIPSGYVDDGKGLPSKFQIKPGQTLSGFSFQSSYPQSAGSFYAGGWIPIPIEGVDFPAGQEPSVANFPNNMFSASLALAPLSNPTLEYGGRRPSVDGFLVFTSIKDGGSYTSPLLIDITFGQQGEIVDTSTFKAVLNGTDVTGQFTVIDSKHRRALIPVGAVLKSGKNVLQTTVQGTVPGASRTAKDTDRLTILVN